MRTLLLLRHAKAGVRGPGLDDRARQLNDRGERSARAMAGLIADLPDRIDLILCSTAERTRQTLGALLQRLNPPPPIDYDDALYLASDRELAAALALSPDDARTVLLVGHNDGIGQLARRLCASGRQPDVTHLRQKYSTGSLAQIALAIDRWADLPSARGELLAYTRPRDLGVI